MKRGERKREREKDREGDKMRDEGWRKIKRGKVEKER